MSNLFNWYILGNTINGDCCTQGMRQEEYIKEKNSYTKHSLIEKRDKAYISLHKDAKLREFKFIQEKIYFSNGESFVNEYTLQNMDAFFYLHDERRNRMLDRLRALNTS